MPCTAPVRGKTDLKYPWKDSINNDPCGNPDVYAGGLCKLHWQLANGLIRGGAQDAATVLLLHCDGADGSTSFVDSSPSGKAVTASGTAKVSTAQSQFSGASALLNTGGAGVLSVPDSPDWAFGAGDFTIDFWVRFSAIATPQVIVAQRETGIFGWTITFLSPNFWRFFYSLDGVTPIAYNPAWTPAAGTWYHVALVRSGATLRFFVNGTQIGADGTVSGGGILADVAAPLFIGAELGGTSTLFVGNLDELRISKGIARWTSNFTPPAAPY